jgi:CubicO group peptidase (beta-lactamase class C family)
MAYLGLFLLLGVIGFLAYTLPVGSAFAAKNMCSCVFVAGMDEATVRAVELAPFGAFRTEVDYQQRQVTGSFWGWRKEVAVYRPGLGCTMAADLEPEALQADVPPAPQRWLNQQAEAGYWPMGDRDTLPLPKGIDLVKLDAAVNEMFVERPDQPSKHTRGLLVVHQGKIVAERYAEGFDRHTPLQGWSMTKSVINAMVGILVRQGKLDIYAPAAVPEWQSPGDPRQAITPDMLLRMSSGLDFTEFYFARTDATEMLFLEADAAGYAAKSELEAPLDTKFTYSSASTNLLSRLVREVLGSDSAYREFPYRELFAPLGMNQVVIEPDAAGTYVGSSYMWCPARDWARFGLLYLHDGVWNGHRILPEGWVRYSATPTPTLASGVYGAQFWTPVQQSDDAGLYEKFVWPRVPEDAFLAEGFEGQMVVIIPSRQTVIVRLGVTLSPSAWSMADLVGDILAALPATDNP